MPSAGPWIGGQSNALGPPPPYLAAAANGYDAEPGVEGWQHLSDEAAPKTSVQVAGGGGWAPQGTEGGAARSAGSAEGEAVGPATGCGQRRRDIGTGPGRGRRGRRGTLGPIL